MDHNLALARSAIGLVEDELDGEILPVSKSRIASL